MNINGMLNGLNKLAEAADLLGPFASMLGADKVINVVKMGLEIADNIADRAKEAGEVLNSNQEANINSITEKLRKVNDELDKQIDAL